MRATASSHKNGLCRTRTEQAHLHEKEESGVGRLYTLILAVVALVGVVLWGTATSRTVNGERPTRSLDQLSTSPPAQGSAVGSIALTPASRAEETVEEATVEEATVEEATVEEPGFEFTVEEVERDAAAAGPHDINLMAGSSK